MDLLKELFQFLNELKQYKEIITNPNSKLLEAKRKNELFAAFPFLQESLPKKSKEEVKEEVREDLVRKSGALSSKIIELTARQYFTKGMSKYDMWVAAFNPLINMQEIALPFCIDAVNEAIGKLQILQEEESGKQIEDLFAALDKPEKVTRQQEKRQDTAITLFDRMQFHPKVVEASRSCFTTVNYRESILNTFISLIDYIKEITGLDLDGDDLMNNVFSFNYDKEQRKITKYPKIRINELKNKTDRDEQHGFMFLCKGAAAFIRNPKAHKLIAQTDPLHTLEYLAFASLLFRQLDKRR